MSLDTNNIVIKYQIDKTDILYSTNNNSNMWVGLSTATDKWIDFCSGATKIVHNDIKDTKIKPNIEHELPDGSKLIIDKDGNYHIDDKNAKVRYKSNNNREFSRHLNASDLLAEFLTDIDKLGIKREEVMKLPLHLFVAWLVIQAAERDNDPIPTDLVPLEQDPSLQSIIYPRCLGCGRFISRLHHVNSFEYCSPAHAEKHLLDISP